MARIVLFFLITFILALLLTLIPAGQFLAALPSTPTPTPPIEFLEIKTQLEQKIQEAISREREYVLGLLVNNIKTENLTISKDYTWASAWIVLTDPETGEILPGEPGLLLAHREDNEWKVALPSEPTWIQMLIEVPTEFVSQEIKDMYVQVFAEQYTAKALLGPFGGYLLPWEGGKTAWLSQSVAHDKYITSGSAHFAFDFYIPQTMFKVYAAKGGTVWMARWTVENNNHEGVGNYLVIQDVTTSPTTYQLYLHLAKDSIPEALRVRGATVVQGQYIGMADNTGQSSGHHLHFQVHTNPDSYWGTAVDITFDDVLINGGRPRRHDGIYSDRPYCKSTDVCEQFQSAYISGNTVHGDVTPPTGGISEPITGITITSQSVRLSGWANDQGSGIAKAQFIANFDGSWKEIGEEFTTSPFSYEWDLCTDNVPQGPVSVALQLEDKEGNPSYGLPGLTHFINQSACPPPPSCTPTDDQIALFSDPNYSGVCTVLGIGEYSSSSAFNAIGDDQIESILVGNNVLATLYSDASYSGRGETFSTNDSNLSDNLIGANTVTSLVVRSRTIPPSPPSTLIAPTNGASFTQETSLTLSWRTPPGATEFQVELNGPNGKTSSSWLSTPYWHLDQMLLTPGVYTWSVRARNCTSSTCWSNYSQSSTFTIISASQSNPSLDVPFTDDFENGTNGWESSGLWNLSNNSERSHSGSHCWYYGRSAYQDYKDGTPNTGDLTSPPINLSSSNTSYILSFWYRYQTEGSGKHWDQRWVQVSQNGGPFENVYQFYDDPLDYWLNPTIDLSKYAGSTVRIRFHFEALDGAFNTYEGWYIDDVVVTASSPPPCSDAGNTLDRAITLPLNQPITEMFCPKGDVDYYRFEGNAGDRIVIDIDTPSDNPPFDLDPVVYLLDSDGTSVLASHDDEINGILKDPHLGYLLPRSSIYYIKVIPWAHPSAGGDNYTYTISLAKDSLPPTALFTYPQSNISIPGTVINLAVDAHDDMAGISHVGFLWHSGDWLNDDWTILGTDWDGRDGWSYSFDASLLNEQTGIAFYAKVVDWAGNWTGIGAWNVTVDRTPPTTAMYQSTKPAGTIILLSWTGNDNASGIDHFELQWQKNYGAWNTIQPNISNTTSHLWFIGDPGSTYGFRIRGVDRAGNVESYPSSAETTVSIPVTSELCSEMDSYENDNSASKAKTINVGAVAQIHNFCNPESSNRLNDQDWLKFYATRGRTYLIRSVPVNGNAPTTLELIAPDGITILAIGKAQGFDEVTTLTWLADRTDSVYLRIQHLDSKAAGGDVSYWIQVLEPYLFMPIVSKNSPLQSSFLPLLNK